MTTSELMEVDLEDAQGTLSLPTPPSQTATDHTMLLGDQIETIGLPSRRNSKSPVDPATSLPNPHPTVKPQRGRSQKAPAAPKAPPTLSTKDIFNFSSSSNLTYDSFWSSHTGPTTPQPTRNLLSDSMADYPSTFQTSESDYTNGVVTTSHPLTNPASTSNDIIPQPNSDRQRNFGVAA